MTRRQYEAHANLEQTAGFTRYQLLEGYEAGVEIIEVRNGNGLRFGICPSRGMDIVWAEWRGLNLTWRHPNGVVAPAFYGAENFDWLRGGPCGLLTTCGLGSFGPPCEDEGERYGIHDRISYVPAREVSAQTRWEGDLCHFEVKGTLRQTRLFGANLRLDRTLTTTLGSNRLLVRDQLTNEGFESAPAVVLYHCNFGYPLLESGTQVIAPGSQVRARDEAAVQGLETWNEVEEPTPGYAEQVFFHDLARDNAGQSRVGLWNPQRSLGVFLRFNGAQLPCFTQWKMLGAGAYVMGLEPSNAPLASRSELRAQDELPSLEPGETRTFEIEFDVVESLPSLP